ncbi:psbP domain-containing protein 1, chloroplastic [Magnolia sinica]|uniref:psbP domain-containing protein 1, chloroplastic n=1 Tax=Magnolia sinica TaxID=86752 RepID=UPI00265A09F1|nr:psbP domain-containing protein 1, chloroplastic [Magnolia sinica]XP_058076894.1 psbP domain-containing protein 1, chloroplastic [Magnolia sinica]XP_058076895.1 psbP domain-containing protein 1, chloroplastic [Magnolia sinica]XP_058076896.1 psbP domain-containing protein 1, chloroplastic [Magnolia sinica]XP_058076897.1 psbP domain-containing protein 1, chloroplastic [Magnolia sinica]
MTTVFESLPIPRSHRFRTAVSTTPKCCSTLQGKRSRIGACTPPLTLAPTPACARSRLLTVCKAQETVTKVPRRHVTAFMLSSLIFSQMGARDVALAEQSIGFREYIDTFDGYTFNYPQNWIQVRGAGADIFFRDPFVLDENLSVELSSPSSSRYKSVEDLGPPATAGEKVLKQYLTEFMSTRLGVRRESNILSTSSRVADDGRIYYQVEVNIKSYANSNELAVMPQDRITRLEWDRRYLSVLGVENNRLYELRLQTPENVFLEEEGDLRRVMESFRVMKVMG